MAAVVGVEAARLETLGLELTRRLLVNFRSQKGSSILPGQSGRASWRKGHLNAA